LSVPDKLGQSAQSDVAGSAGDIQQTLAGTGLQRRHHLALPPAMDASAHQIVHQIVTFGDAVEDSADQRRLFTFGYAPEAEIGASACVFVTHRAGT
jgi:hypothetical protein